MLRVQLWFPHLTKMLMSDLPEGWDPSDPPLTEEANAQAETLFDEAIALFGPPALIASSPKMRAQQTIAPLVRRFGDLRHNGVLYTTLTSLMQTESGDHLPNDPRADNKGFVLFGPRSNDRHWSTWAEQSARMLEIMSAQTDRPWPIYVGCHRPIVAAMRWNIQHPGRVPEIDDIPTTDKSVFPYCAFVRSTGPSGWEELPRDPEQLRARLDELDRLSRGGRPSTLDPLE